MQSPLSLPNAKGGTCELTRQSTLIDEKSSNVGRARVRPSRPACRSRCITGTSCILVACNQRPCFPWPFKIRTIATMVFQFRVVAGTPNSLSIWPRYPIVFM